MTVREARAGDQCYLIANSSGKGVAGTLDGSYYKGQGLRQGIEREYVVVVSKDNGAVNGKRI